MKSYSAGTTPENIIEELLPEIYNMELTSEDYSIFASLVNIGIDSRLQAIFISNSKIKDLGNKAGISLDKPSMVCLINRLWDYSEFGGSYNPNILSSYESDTALDLRSAILQTIGIEEV